MPDTLERADGDSSRDTAKAAQEARAKQYHIAVKDGGNLTKPGKWSDVDDDLFADPVNYRYPIKDVTHANNAASRWGDASNREQYSPAEQKIIEDRIQARQKALGVASAQNDHKERAMPDESLARAANHDPFTGTHSHSHAAHGSQGDDATHEHEHSHDNDNNHDHTHSDERAVPDGILALDGYTPHMTFPIIRSDPKTWSVYGRATVEQPDHHGTIFSYEGAKGAFARWRGNIREQHDKHRPVGSRIEHTFNDDEKGVYLLARISKTRPETWERVLDGTLNDFSVNVIPDPKYGTDPRLWPKKEYNGKKYPYLPEYDYAEISIVDSGSAPGASVTPIMRADGEATDILAPLDDEAITEPPTQERAGRAVSAATKSKLHDSIGHTLMAAKSQMQNCAEAGCDECAAALKQLDPDNDGDIDAFGGAFGDTDNDAADLYGGNDDGDTARALEGLIERIVQTQLSSVYSRLQGIASALARSIPSVDMTSFESLVTGAIARAVEAADAKTATSLSEVRAEVSAVKATVERIDATPLPGAPPGPGARPPVDKQLATDPYQPPRQSGSSVYDALSRMSEAGLLDTPEQQANALAAGLLAQRQGR